MSTFPIDRYLLLIFDIKSINETSMYNIANVFYII